MCCNSIKGGKGGGLGFDCWALLPGENDMNVGISVLPGLQSLRLKVAYITNNCPWCHQAHQMHGEWLPMALNICHTSFTQRITLHISKERQAKNKMQKHILVAVPKNIYKNLLCVITIGQTVQSSSKAPCTWTFRECQRRQIHLCLPDGLAQEQSTAVQLYIRNQLQITKKYWIWPSFLNMIAFVVDTNAFRGC